MNQFNTETIEICQDDYEELFQELENWMQEQEDNNLMISIADDYEANQDRDEVDGTPSVLPLSENMDYNETEIQW